MKIFDFPVVYRFLLRAPRSVARAGWMKVVGALALTRWIVLLVLLAAMPSFAQQPDQADALKKLPPLPFRSESVGDYSAPGVKVKGLVAGTVLSVDQAFTAKHENTPPNAPFRLVVPKGNVLFLPGGKKTGVPELVRFTTGTEDKRAIEILRFTNLSVPVQPDPADRLKLCAHLLKTQGLASASRGYENVRFLGAYATKVGGNDAVSVHAYMTKPGTGEHFAVKLVGILHPSQSGGVLAFLMADSKLSDIKGPEDLASKGIGLAIIHSLRFIDAPGTGAPR